MRVKVIRMPPEHILAILNLLRDGQNVAGCIAPITGSGDLLIGRYVAVHPELCAVSFVVDGTVSATG